MGWGWYEVDAAGSEASESEGLAGEERTGVGGTTIKPDIGSRGLVKAWGVDRDMDHGGTFVSSARTESGVNGGLSTPKHPADFSVCAIWGGSGAVDGVYARCT